MNTWETIDEAVKILEDFDLSGEENEHYTGEIKRCIKEIREESDIDQMILKAFEKKLGNKEYEKVVQKVIEFLEEL